MSKPSVVVVGASGHARVILDIIRSEDRYEIVGLVDSFKPVGTELAGFRVLGDEAFLADAVRIGDIHGVIVGIGDNSIRSRITASLAAAVPGLPFFSAIHARATVSPDSVIGPGTVLMAGAVVNPGCKIGAGCIINTNASIDHDGRMDDFSSLAPACSTGGNVSVGTHSAIGIGAILFHAINVGEHTVIGGGAVVTRDIPACSVAMGVPARVVRQREPGQRYL